MAGYETEGDSTVGTCKSEMLIEQEFWGRLRHMNKTPFSIETSLQRNGHIIIDAIYRQKYPVVYWVDYNTNKYTKENIF
jgi:hypothetical protein